MRKEDALRILLCAVEQLARHIGRDDIVNRIVDFYEEGEMKEKRGKAEVYIDGAFRQTVGITIKEEENEPVATFDEPVYVREGETFYWKVLKEK